MRDVQPVTIRKSDSPTSDTIEEHPSFGAIQISRVSAQPAAALFQSDVRNPTYINIRICEADRRRGLSHDHVFPGKQIIEVALSLTQWGEFVSSFNQGAGVPCTIEHRQTGEYVDVPSAPFESRFEVSLTEVKDKTIELVGDITEAFEGFMALRDAKAPKKQQDDALRALQARIENAPGNARFTADSLVKHMNGVVGQARTEINEHIRQRAAAVGLNPGDITLKELESGD